ncbi:MAG: bacillithiol system redox-active protein YtxJ [Flavobacteriaceae bacterium]
MGLFEFFGKKEANNAPDAANPMPWLSLTRIEQLDALVETSKTIPVVIFKHSTTCGISRMVLRNFEKTYAVPEGSIKLYYLDLLAFRAVSNEVASRFGVWHQSPQLIIVKNGESVYDASHQGIDASSIQKFI